MLRLPEVEVEPTPIDWRDLPNRFVNPGEIERMVSLLQGLMPVRMAEFGVNFGRTARLILENVPTIREYIGVDVMPGYIPALPIQRYETTMEPGRFVRPDPRFHLNVLPSGTRDLTIADLGTLDALFIDGDHSREGVEFDSRLAYRVVRPGGLIIWHDYHDLGTVDVSDVLHELRDAGHDIRHVAGSWLAFERVGALKDAAE